MQRLVLALACGMAAVPLVGIDAASAQACRSDGDCPMGSACEKEESGSCADAAPRVPGDGVPQTPVCEDDPAPESGECRPLPLVCESADDCPAGLQCQRSASFDCAVPSADDGDMPTPPPDCIPQEEPEGLCAYEPIACTSDMQCGHDEVCTLLGGEQRCTSDPGAPCVGDSCPPPPEETCTTVMRKFCFPKRVDCTSSADCGGAQRCVALSDDIKDDAPALWRGADRLCLPEGLALLVEGAITVVGGSGASESHSTAARDGSGVEEDSKGSPDAMAAHAPHSAPQTVESCTVARPGAESGTTSALVLVLLGVGVRVARRRLRA